MTEPPRCCFTHSSHSSLISIAATSLWAFSSFSKKVVEVFDPTSANDLHLHPPRPPRSPRRPPLLPPPLGHLRQRHRQNLVEPGSLAVDLAGPPFATGLPHYGHLLADTIKDIVTRYQSMTGHHITRRFGWDCHGLPVETQIDEKLKIKSREDVLNMGIGVYNEECRSIVTRYVDEWEKVVTRSGRWIDFRNLQLEKCLR